MPTFAEPNRAGPTNRIQGSTGPRQPIYWRCDYEVAKFAAGAADVRAGVYGATAGPDAGRPVTPYETINGAGNMLVNGGADIFWVFTRGPGTTSANAQNTYFNAHAGVGVGNSTTAVARTHTDLQANSSRKARKGMESTYPTHTTGTGSTSVRNTVFRALFSTAQANFAWQEWGVFNSTTAGQGRMLNRKVESLGTKTTAATWQMTVTLSLST